MAKKKNEIEETNITTPLPLKPGKGLYFCLMTPPQLSSNNRAGTDGNLSLLPKVFDGHKWRVITQSDSIRLALRYGAQVETEREHPVVYIGGREIPVEINRQIHLTRKSSIRQDGAYETSTSLLDGKEVSRYFRDDMSFGYFNARPAKGDSTKGTCSSRTTMVNVSSAISLNPVIHQQVLNHYATPGSGNGNGDDNDKSVASAAGDSEDNGNESEATEKHCTPHSEEAHYSSYSYCGSINTGMISFLDEKSIRQEVACVFRQIQNIPPVGGNHARYAYDFSPLAIVLRVHDTDMSSKVCNAFVQNDKGESLSDTFVNRFNGDFGADEIIIGTLSNSIFEQASGILLNGKPYFVEGKNLFRAITPAVNAFLSRI